MSGGYDLYGCGVVKKNGQVVDSELLTTLSCVMCKLLLRGACQITCGDRCCRNCIPQQIFVCPACKDSVDPTAKQAYFADKRCQKDIRDLIVVCKCGEKLPMEQWDSHTETCPVLGRVKPRPVVASNGGQSSAGIGRFATELESVRSDVSELKKISKSSMKKVENVERELSGMRTTLESLKHMVQERNMSETVTQLVADVETHKGTLAQMAKGLDELNASVPRFETMLEEMNLKVEILEVKSCTGVYVWKINELTRRSREAKQGRTISLYSPPFYTSTHGYRLCLRAYLNGDGDGKGTHVSLFIVIMKSEYDDILKWPFSHKVTLTLVNQANPAVPDKSITHSFQPNPKSSSFQKPEETFNIASGFPIFTKVSNLINPDFSRNDTVYFRVKLDPPSGDKSSPDMINYS